MIACTHKRLSNLGVLVLPALFHYFDTKTINPNLILVNSQGQFSTDKHSGFPNQNHRTNIPIGLINAKAYNLKFSFTGVNGNKIIFDHQSFYGSLFKIVFLVNFKHFRYKPLLGTDSLYTGLSTPEVY